MKKEYVSPVIEQAIVETTASYATSGTKEEDTKKSGEADDGIELGAKPNFDIWENDGLSEEGIWS